MTTPRAESLTDELPGTWAEMLPHLRENAGTYWLTATRTDGRPHTRPLLAVWVADMPCFATGEGTAKAGLLSASAPVSLAFGTGRVDVVVEGTVERLRDPARLRSAARAYAERYGWTPVVSGEVLTGAEGAPTAGPPPYGVYTIHPSTVYAFPAGELPHGPTRWRFAP